MCAVGPDDVIGAPGLLRQGKLRLDSLARILEREAVARSQPPNLLRWSARGDHHRVEIRVASRFVQQGDVGHCKGHRRKRGKPCLDGLIHRGMHDGLQIPARFLVTEDNAAERLPVDAAVRRADGRAKSFQDARGARCARCDRRVREGVGVDGGNTVVGEPPPNPRLPRRDPAGERDRAHPARQARDMAGLLASRASAATSVLLRSSAIVSGPTPPGTGVSAPATAETPGWTSPTTSAPRLAKAERRGDSGGNSRSTSAASVTRLVPTSITVAPGFIHSGWTNAVRPMATTTRSASRTTDGRSFVREWQIVTVACSWSNSIAMGFPTMSLRPTTTARAPFNSIPDRCSSSITPR